MIPGLHEAEVTFEDDTAFLVYHSENETNDKVVTLQSLVAFYG